LVEGRRCSLELNVSVTRHPTCKIFVLQEREFRTELNIYHRESENGSSGPFPVRCRALLLAYAAPCPAILHYHFGPNDSDRGKGYTHVNLRVFTSRAAHEAYQRHPLHHEMHGLMIPRMEFVVCDYEVSGLEV
jgi:hypothetical protein